jgi:hypothetical protein
MLVVADPPHGDVNEKAAAALIGLPSGETRLKLDFRAPEVLAVSSPGGAADTAGSLRAAGVNVMVCDGRELARIPWPSLASSFELGRQGVLFRVGEELMELPYDAPALGVVCRPPSDFAPFPPDAGATVTATVGTAGLAATEAMEGMAHLDLYFEGRGELRRVAIAEGLVDFSGLGEQLRDDPADNFSNTVAELRRRFGRMDVDDRLDGVRPRRRFVAGEEGFNPDMRKRYAFGTLILRHVLESISPELRDLTQYDFGSRLAYVLSRAA